MPRPNLIKCTSALVSSDELLSGKCIRVCVYDDGVCVCAGVRDSVCFGGGVEDGLGLNRC